MKCPKDCIDRSNMKSSVCEYEVTLSFAPLLAWWLPPAEWWGRSVRWGTHPPCFPPPMEYHASGGHPLGLKWSFQNRSSICLFCCCSRGRKVKSCLWSEVEKIQRKSGNNIPINCVLRLKQSCTSLHFMFEVNLNNLYCRTNMKSLSRAIPQLKMAIVFRFLRFQTEHNVVYRRKKKPSDNVDKFKVSH